MQGNAPIVPGPRHQIFLLLRAGLTCALLTEDSSIVCVFMGDAQRVSERLAVRFKELIY
jgi:hypothetical protein